MGMFDSFYVQHRGKEIEVQSKQFSCVLAIYHLGDFVEFEHDMPTGVRAFVERIYPDRRGVATSGWCVFLMLNGCFLDYLVCDDDKDEAYRASEVMVKLWQQPERQIDGLLRVAGQHHAARKADEALLYKVIALLSRYQSWVECSGAKPDRVMNLHWHDFSEMPWDVALARIFAERDDFRCLLPEKYFSSGDA